ncbi:hypothetical protein EVAR_13665_1 [Eumeta japonica]|uniref:Uncharacterized protein n=1 Tax=Eumeta variegata TaxID=151549 RepID=A0A4C1UC53_EUMVA|nr:hypothetical protein EVAR_13665_1 [Eumeta japonica]
MYSTAIVLPGCNGHVRTYARACPACVPNSFPGRVAAYVPTANRTSAHSRAVVHRTPRRIISRISVLRDDRAAARPPYWGRPRRRYRPALSALHRIERRRHNGRYLFHNTFSLPLPAFVYKKIYISVRTIRKAVRGDGRARPRYLLRLKIVTTSVRLGDEAGPR